MVQLQGLSGQYELVMAWTELGGDKVKPLTNVVQKELFVGSTFAASFNTILFKTVKCAMNHW